MTLAKKVAFTLDDLILLKDLSACSRTLILFILLHTKFTDRLTVQFSIKDAGRHLSYCRSSIKKAIRELEKKKIVKVDRACQRANIYIPLI